MGVESVFVTRDYKENSLEIADEITTTLHWNATNATSEEEAALAVMIAAGPYYRSLPLSRISLSSKEGPAEYKFATEYTSTRSAPISSVVTTNTEDVETSYALSGEQKHITQSLSTRGKHSDGMLINGGSGTYTDPGAIGLTKDSVKGVDIETAIEEWSETHYFLRSYLTYTVRNRWRQVYNAPLNSGSFRGYSAEEVRFTGVQCTVKGSPYAIIPVTFSFKARKHEESVTIGEITVDQIKGWEAVDVRYKDVTNTSTKRTEKKPDKVLLHTVYNTSDFALLGISTE